MTETVETIAAGPSAGIPNHPHWPALLVRDALDPARAEETFRANGWTGTWRWTVFDYHHFHPDSHEALAVVSGRASLALGGPDGPVVEVSPGDVTILPAGFGHCRIASDPDFAVVGAYPPGQASPEILRADESAVAAMGDRAAAVPLPGCPLGAGITHRYWVQR